MRVFVATGDVTRAVVPPIPNPHPLDRWRFMWRELQSGPDVITSAAITCRRCG